MRRSTTFLFVAALLAISIQGVSAQQRDPKEIKTEMRLEGFCAKIFGRSRISFADAVPGQLPVAPIAYDGIGKGSCTISLKYTYKGSSKPAVGLSVAATRLLSTDSNGTQDKRLSTVKTDANGVARFRFRWDSSSCGVDFTVFDPRDPSEAGLTWPTTLLTGDAFFQIRKCQGTFISQGLSRADICNGEPKDQ